MTEAPGRELRLPHHVLKWSRVIEKARKLWGSGVPLPRVDSLIKGPLPEALKRRYLLNPSIALRRYVKT